MGVTCHWIDACTFEQRSVALACRRFVGSHTCDGVAQLIYVIHYELGLTHDKIVATISDNGSNFVKAFKEFSVAIVHSRDTIVMVIKIRKRCFQNCSGCGVSGSSFLFKVI